MNLWLVTSIRIGRGEPLRASAIQNLQTGLALAEEGHGVLLWVAGLEKQGERIIEERLGRTLPTGLRLMPYKPRGPQGEKKTPFSRPLDRLLNTLRARRAAPAPDAVITRSPRLLAQLRESKLLPARTRLILEYQYPEWALLWRGWRNRHAQAPLRECVKRLRELRRCEDRWLALADGILYAAKGHERLLSKIRYRGPARWLPSGCLPPVEAPPENAEIIYDLGYVGSLAPENGLECLLEAAARLEGGRLLLVGGGGGAYVARLKRRVEELGLAGRVEFLGPVDFKDVRGQMRRCRVGLAPISDREGPEKRQYASPLKLIEWMAAGVPVIASAVPSVRQFAVDEQNVLLVLPHNPGALAGAVRRALATPALRARLINNGLKTARQATFQNRARLIADFIQKR